MNFTKTSLWISIFYLTCNPNPSKSEKELDRIYKGIFQSFLITELTANKTTACNYKQIGSNLNDANFQSVYSTDGSFYSVGFSEGQIQNEATFGDLDATLIRTDKFGNVQRIRQVGSPMEEYGYGIAQDSDNNTFITGGTKGSIDSFVNTGGQDIFLYSFDKSGNKRWSYQGGTANDDYGYGLALDSSKNIFLLGMTMGNLDGNITAGLADIFLSKFDPSGNRIWTKQIKTSNADFPTNIKTDRLGNVYIVGSTKGNMNGNLNRGGVDYFISKYDTNGIELWTKQFGTVQDEFITSLVVTNQNLYLGGMGNIDPSKASKDYESATIFLKLDLNGNLVSQQNILGVQNSINALQVDPQGNMYALGVSTNPNFQGIKSNGSTDAF